MSVPVAARLPDAGGSAPDDEAACGDLSTALRHAPCLTSWCCSKAPRSDCSQVFLPGMDNCPDAGGHTSSTHRTCNTTYHRIRGGLDKTTEAWRRPCSFRERFGKGAPSDGPAQSPFRTFLRSSSLLTCDSYHRPAKLRRPTQLGGANFQVGTRQAKPSPPYAVRYLATDWKVESTSGGAST
jgi:hypothetical protein